MKFCTKCGKEVVDEALFCTSCGAKMPEESRGNGPEQTMQVVKVDKTFEIVSFVVGIFSLSAIGYGVLGLIGLLCNIKAWKNGIRSGLLYAGLLLSILGMILGVMVPAVFLKGEMGAAIQAGIDYGKEYYEGKSQVEKDLDDKEDEENKEEEEIDLTTYGPGDVVFSGQKLTIPCSVTEIEEPFSVGWDLMYSEDDDEDGFDPEYFYPDGYDCGDCNVPVLRDGIFYGDGLYLAELDNGVQQEEDLEIVGFLNSDYYSGQVEIVNGVTYGMTSEEVWERISEVGYLLKDRDSSSDGDYNYETYIAGNDDGSYYELSLIFSGKYNYLIDYELCYYKHESSYYDSMYDVYGY